jgi:hypothetical protein
MIHSERWGSQREKHPIFPEKTRGIAQSRVISCILFSNLKIQIMACKCSGKKVPTMFLNQAASKSRRDAFIAKQFTQLRDLLDPAGPYEFYSIADFSKMITFFRSITNASAVRIYIANFGDDDDTPDPFTNRISFIWSVAEITQKEPDLMAKDLRRYFNVPPGRKFTPTGSEIDPGLASKWVTNWQTGGLSRLAVLDKPDNHDGNNKLSDTKSIIYQLDQLQEVVEELACQEAAGIRLYLASYLGDEPTHPGRLNTQFEMIDVGGDVFTIDLTCRVTEEVAFGFDTGSPCPPAVGCTSGFLP